MKTHVLALGISAAAMLAVGACDKKATDSNGVQTAQTPKAQKAAGTKTIAAGIAANGKFMAAAKAAGLDQTLAGPGPYTVFVPDDGAFDTAPAGTFDPKPENRAQLTGVLTNLIPVPCWSPTSTRRSITARGRRCWRRWAAARSPRPRTAARPC